jgi:phenylpyruvate tautomerase
MPFIKLETTVSFDAEERASLCRKLSRIAAEVIGKPETYVQAAVVDRLAMLHGGEEGPAAFVEVRSIGGLSPKVNRALAERVCAVLVGIGLASERVYLNFIDVPAANWGHDGATFG